LIIFKMIPERVKILATDLMTEHDLHSKNWRFRFDNAKQRLGNCSYKRRTISMSKHFAVKITEPEAKDVLLHEIAHALVGRGQGHNHVWKRKAIEIGCNGLREYHGDIHIKAKYIGTCPTCGRVIKRHRRKNISCGRCSGGSYNSKHAFIWSLNTD